jgi:hypothetical protein
MKRDTMPIDLYDEVYKRFYQRSYRYPEDYDLLEMSQLAHDLIRNLYRIQMKGLISQDDINNALNAANTLLDLEIIYGGFSILFSRRLITALEKNVYEIKVPKHKMSSWLEEEDHLGTLYVLTAKSRPGQCKLGVTQGNLEERIIKYQYRHHYSVDLYFFKHDIPTPFRHEEAITKKFLMYKNSNISDGQSNEWFFLDPIKLKKEILKIKIKESSHQ